MWCFLVWFQVALRKATVYYKSGSLLPGLLTMPDDKKIFLHWSWEIPVWYLIHLLSLSWLILVENNELRYCLYITEKQVLCYVVNIYFENLNVNWKVNWHPEKLLIIVNRIYQYSVSQKWNITFITCTGSLKKQVSALFCQKIFLVGIIRMYSLRCGQ